MRAVPFTIQAYQLEMPAQEIRQKIRKDFLAQGTIKDPEIIDILVFKANSELDDTLRIYKTKSHVMRLLRPFESKDETLSKDKDLLRRFYDGFELPS